MAKEYNIPFQYEITPGPTGTDGRAMQITREGIPTLCLSIPLRYMHTSVEVADMIDIKNTGKLLAFFLFLLFQMKIWRDYYAIKTFNRGRRSLWQ